MKISHKVGIVLGLLSALVLIIGVISIASLARITDTANEVIDDQMRIAENSAGAIGLTEHLLALSHEHASSTSGLEQSGNKITSTLDRIRQHLQAIDDPKLTELTQRVNKQLDALTDSVMSLLEIDAIHASYRVVSDGINTDLKTFVYETELRLNDWIGQLEDAVKFDAAFNGNTDLSKSAYAGFHRTNKTSDSKLSGMLDNYAELEEKIFEFARKVNSASGDRKKSHFERGKARNLGKARRTLAEIRDYVAPRVNEVILNKQTVLEEINNSAQQIRESLAELDTQVKNNTIQATQNLQKTAGNINYLLLGIVVLSLILALASAIIAIRILGPLKDVIGIFKSIGDGNYNNDIVVKSRDEIGVLLSELNALQYRLEVDVTNAHEQARAANRIKTALDNVSGNVMVTDTDGTIIYMNEAVCGMMRNAESDLRKELPHFDASKLVGENIDVFHENLAHQRSLLAGVKDTDIANIVVGGRHMRVIANPVIGEAGACLGTVAEWVDRTQEVSIEEEIQGIVNASLDGDLTRRIDTGNKSGFFERLSRSVNELVDVSERVINDTVSVLGAMAQGDLTRTIKADYHGSFGELKENINSTIGKLTEVLGEITESANSVSRASSEIAEGNTNLSQRTEEQASSLEETVSSMEEMTSTVRQNADNARLANQLATGARTQAEKGGEVVNDAVAAMSEITAASKKIADIIGVIDEIAFQTNLLALNAAVEAARAGEQGRGFAVVASEVRNLAGRSATAARGIKDLIEDSVGKVDEGSKLVDKSGQTLEEIMNSVKKVSDIIAEIADASTEQSDGIAQVNMAIAQMDRMTQQNAALVEQAAAASESMGEQARSLSDLVGFFTTTGTGTAKHTAERRGTERPWGEKQDKPVTSPARDTRRTASSSVDLNAGDGEWEEF